MSQPKNKKLLIILGFLVCGMFAFCFALVPLYNTFCKAFGINGKTSGRYEYSGALEADPTRTITIEFITSVNNNIPWKFKPSVGSIKLHPGESKQVNFIAKNLSNNQTTGRAIPSVSPGFTAKYLRKTECFCFQEQTLKPHEEKIMPVIFFIDKKIDREIQELTLSYTMFNANREISKTDLDKISEKGKITGHLN